MAVVATYGLMGKDAGILAIAFPGVRVLRGPGFPAFVFDQHLIVFSDLDPFTCYPEIEIIQITQNAAMHLDSREGFLRFLATQRVKATAYQIELLRTMNEEDFWPEAKMALLTEEFPTIPRAAPAEKRGALYRLFDVLFEDFDRAYVEYQLLRRSASPFAIFSGLVTMHLKSSGLEPAYGVTPFYRKILHKNRAHTRTFKRAVLEHLGSVGNPQSATDCAMLAFLLQCSDPEKWDSACA